MQRIVVSIDSIEADGCCMDAQGDGAGESPLLIGCVMGQKSKRKPVPLTLGEVAAPAPTVASAQLR